MNITYSVEKLHEEVGLNGKYVPSEIGLYKTVTDDAGVVVVKVKLTPEDIQKDGLPDAAKEQYLTQIVEILQEQLAEILNDNIKSSHPGLGGIFGRNLTAVLNMISAVKGYMEMPNGSLTTQ